MTTDESRYILAKKIARGGMAEIYLGKHIGHDGFQRLCAIKRILPHYAQDQEFVQMFRDEAHICKRLQHANIVRVEGFEEVEDSYAIIMEYVDGSDLRSILSASEQASRRMTIPMACYIIAETARGLHYAHTKVDEITQQKLGIVHRDISPQNILLSFEGEVKVTDFGIADAESKITETRPGIVKGKYSYMSPEQIAAKPVDARTDVFAMSIVLWEILAMRRLFQGQNEVDTIQRVKNCKIDYDLRELNEEVDEDLAGIIRTGLAKDPKKRFKSAAEFEKELRRYLSRRHPDFTSEDLGAFLKKVLDKKRAESAADIKKTLTEPEQKPGKKRSGENKKGSERKQASSSKAASGNKDGDEEENAVNLDLDSSSSPISLAQPAGAQGPALSGPSGPPRQFSRGSSRSYSQSYGAGGRTGMNRHHGYGPRHHRKPSRRKNRFWLFATVATAAFSVALVFFSQLTAHDNAAYLILRTQPSRVKVTIDRKAVNRGEYVLASSRNPLRISLKPGRHVIRIYRPGYKMVRFVLPARAGKKHVKDNIVLEEKSEIAAVKVLLPRGQPPARVNINDGYYVANLIPRKNSTITPDLVYGKAYKMMVYPKGKKRGRFLCRFVPKSTSWREPTLVTVNVEKERCRVKTP